MTPAEVVVATFGGIRPAARAAKLNPSTVLRWTRPRKQGGTGGIVPLRYWDQLMAEAEREGKRLTESHLKSGTPGIRSTVYRLLDGRRNSIGK